MKSQLSSRIVEREELFHSRDAFRLPDRRNEGVIYEWISMETVRVEDEIIAKEDDLKEMLNNIDNTNESSNFIS